MSEVRALSDGNSPGWVRRVSRIGPMPSGHSHREPELNLVISGRARYILDRRQYELSPRTIVWLFPEPAHMLMAPSPDFSMWVVVFHPRLIERVCRSECYRILNSIAPPGRFCRKLSRDDHFALDAFLAELAFHNPNTDRLESGLGYLLPLAWDFFARSGEPEESREVHPAVQKAATLIAENPDRGLGKLAAQAGLSRSQLSRLFHVQTGATLCSYRNQKRLEIFLDLYGCGQRTTMLSAALDAGFGSYAQFHRVFKTFMGCGPAEYRRVNF